MGNQIQPQWKLQWRVYNVGSTYTVSHCAAKTICLYIPLCHSKSSCPSQHIVLLFSALPLSSQRGKWKGHWIASQKTRVLTPVSCPWASYLQSLRWPSLIFSKWPVGCGMASTLSHSDMPSSLAFSHQPHDNFSLRVLFLFLLFGSILWCCCKGPVQTAPFWAPTKHLDTLPFLPLAFLLNYHSKGIATLLGRDSGPLPAC